MSVDPSTYYLIVAAAVPVLGAIAGVGHSIAAIIRENAKGKALVIRAESDAELAKRIGVPTPEPPVAIDAHRTPVLFGMNRPGFAGGAGL